MTITPPFPDYIAGHTTYAGAGEEVLEHVFGAYPAVVMKLTSAAAPGVVGTYTSFEQIAEGVVEARVWGRNPLANFKRPRQTAGEQVGRLRSASFPQADGRRVRRQRMNDCVGWRTTSMRAESAIGIHADERKHEAKECVGESR
jgi:hypothetical protein